MTAIYTGAYSLAVFRYMPWLETQITMCSQNAIFHRSLPERVSRQYSAWLGADLRIILFLLSGDASCCPVILH